MVTILEREEWSISDDKARRVHLPLKIMSETKLFVSYIIQPAFQENIIKRVTGNLSNATLIREPQTTFYNGDYVNLNMWFEVTSDWSLENFDDFKVNGTELMKVELNK